MEEAFMASVDRLKKDYPWIKTPLVVGAPMRLIALAPLALEISRAGGIGFIGAGTDVSTLEDELLHAQRLLSSNPMPSYGLQTNTSSTSTLPLGIGFINWGAATVPSLDLIRRFRPAAVWFFAPHDIENLQYWTTETRSVAPSTRVWVQVGCVTDAAEVVRHCHPDVLVVQGTDAGGHGLVQGAGIVSLMPEVSDAVEEMVRKGVIEEEQAPALLAAGGIAEGRGAAAVLALGAAGVVMGTRFLASWEANVAKGYRDEVVRAKDGGQSTVRTKVYDTLRGTTGWAEGYNARGLINKSFVDAAEGMGEEENKRLYQEELAKGNRGWGADGRLTTYAGAAVGLVREIKPAAEIVVEVREGARRVIELVRRRVREIEL
ncbi:inosine monophosphate dehydrogenase [Lepidopterella palustris CBS 459.81]|uniref:Inosine monophosphate dehydrogenase n=1 Tax=Lepidopterella palustris CBS 459.81 TaxID=1314670 RepID=A0A8E2JHJ4_9PEZI|nr:inosine monophosphate dehydrogenase [Lepidopterella palustris CBS 459.81]